MEDSERNNSAGKRGELQGLEMRSRSVTDLNRAYAYTLILFQGMKAFLDRRLNFEEKTVLKFVWRMHELSIIFALKPTSQIPYSTVRDACVFQNCLPATVACDDDRQQRKAAHSQKSNRLGSRV